MNNADLKVLVKKCIDLDQWKHSWHNKFKTMADFELAREVIQNKICVRDEELSLLRNGLSAINAKIEVEREYLAKGEE